MATQTWYVIKSTTFNRKKMNVGDELLLTESQSRPLRSGGFISADKAAADRIAVLTSENAELKTVKDKNPESEMTATVVEAAQ